MSITAAGSQSLRCLLIPLQTGQVIVPHSSVVEVVSGMAPLPLAQAPAWVYGGIVFRAHTLPLISLDRLISDKAASFQAYTRIIVVNAPASAPVLPYVGVLGVQSPRPIMLDYDDIAVDRAAGPAVEGISSRVRVKGQAAIIPDITALATVLTPLERLYF